MTTQQKYYQFGSCWVDDTHNNPIPFTAWAAWAPGYDGFLHIRPNYVAGSPTRVTTLPYMQFNCKDDLEAVLLGHPEAKEAQLVKVRPVCFQLTCKFTNFEQAGVCRLVQLTQRRTHWLGDAYYNSAVYLSLPSLRAAKIIKDAIVPYAAALLAPYEDAYIVPHPEVTNVSDIAIVHCYSRQRQSEHAILEQPKRNDRVIDFTPTPGA